jgi:hypothetical protein
MDPTLLTVIVVLGAALFVTTVYMEWIGLLGVLSPRRGTRHKDCGHLRVMAVDGNDDRCWNCRHPRMHHAIEVGRHPLHR